MKRLPVALISLATILLASSQGWGQLTGKSLILQDSSAPAKKVTLRTPGSLSSSYSLIYPSALPQSNGYLLTGSTSGALSWSDPATVVGSLAWLLGGNLGTTVPTADTIVAGQNFLGTRDARELVLGTNSVRRVRIDGSTGYVGIGAAPSATDRLNVHGMINTDSSFNIGSTNWLWMGPALGGRNNVLVGNTGNTVVAADDNTFVGASAGAGVTTGNNNTIMGSQAGRATKDGTDNTYIGAGTATNNAGGSSNTVIGSAAANFASSGDNNTIVGAGSASALINGSGNTLIGTGSLSNGNAVNDMTMLGVNTGVGNTATTNATAIGANAFVGSDNSLVLGSINGINGALADANVGIGTSTPTEKFEVMDGNILMSNQGVPMQLRIQEPAAAGSNYTGFTTQAQAANIVYTLPGAAPAANNYLMTATTGGLMSWSSPASIVGSVGWLLTGNNITSGGTGANQQFIGTTTGNKQPFVMATNGVERARIDSNGLVGIGTTPLANTRVNVHGMINTDSAYEIGANRWLWAGTAGDDNTLVGNTTNGAVSGDDNTLVGFRAGAATTSGIQNTYVGSLAGRSSTGDDNTSIGFGAGGLATSGSANSMFGSGSGGVVTTGANNTMLGFAAGQSVTTGSGNTLVGMHAGNTLGAASDNTFIGTETNAKFSTLTNATAIGAHATVSNSNALVLGSIAGQNGATSDVNVGIGTPSPSEKLQINNGNLSLSNTNGVAGRLIMQDSTNGHTTSFVPQTQAANITYVLPAAAAAANGYLLTSTTGGVMSWSDPAAVVGSTAWLLSGNNITSGGTGANQQFIGTTTGNTQPFVLATNGAERMRIDNTGRAMIGTATAAAERLTVIDTVAPAAVSDLFNAHMRLFFNPSVAWSSTAAANGLRADIVVKNSAAIDGERIAGVIAAATMDGAASAPVAQLRGLRGNIIQSSTTQTLGHGIAVEGNIQNAGLMTNATSFLAKMNNQAGSTTTTDRGFWMQQPDIGTVGTVIGVDIDPLTMATTNIALRYNHATSPVVITGAGALGVGTAAPGEKAEVKNGNLLLSNSGTAGELRLQEPNASGSNYSAFKAQAQAADITYTLPPSLPVTNDYVLTSSTGGSLDWKSPATLVSGSFVQYNVPTPQGTAVASNRLFDVRYGGLAAGADALGARIASTSGTNANATGLTISSTGNGTGNSTGLTVAATGGASNYAATFTAGNVGIGTATPTNRLTVAYATPTGVNADYTGTEMVTTFAPTVAYNSQVNGAESILLVNNSAALTATLGTINAIDAGTIHDPSATVAPTELTGIRGWAASNNATVATKYAKGVYGYIQNNGKIDSAAGFYTDAAGTAGSSLGTWRGLHVGNAAGIPVTNTIGIDINKQAEGSSSNIAFRYNNPTSPIVMLGNGNVGIGLSNPTSKLYVNDGIGTASSDTQMVAMWNSYSPSANPAPNVSVAAQIVRMLFNPSFAQTSGLLSGADMGASLVSTATAGMAEVNGIRGFAASANTSQTLTNAVGIMGHVQNAGRITNGISLEANAQLLTNGAMTNYIGLKVLQPAMSGGSVQNVYGISIDSLSGGTSSNYAFRYNLTTLPTVITSFGQVGIGTATPSNLLDVRQTQTPGATTTLNTVSHSSTVAPTAAYSGQAATTTTVLLLNNTVPVTTGNIRSTDMGSYILPTATGAVTRLEGGRAFARNESNATLTTGVGIEGLVWADGPITNAYGASVGPTIAPTGNMGTFVGLNVESPNLQAGGTLSNFIGIDIAQQSLAGTNTAFRYNHATAPFIITGGGNVGIGNSAPTASLDVNGGVVMREDASVANVPNDNFPVTVGNRSYLRIGCTTAGAANLKTITLSAGLRVGQVLVIEGTGFNAFEIDDNAAVNRTNTPAARQMVNNAVETMIWNGTAWVEVSFAQN